MMYIDNLTGLTHEVEDIEIPNEEPQMLNPPPTAEERIEALEMALLEVILNG